MFDYVDMLQGPSRGAVDSDEEGEVGRKPKQAPPAPKPDGEEAAAASAGGAFSLWGMATALAEGVKKSTAEITASMKDTDWRAEIESFGKGVAEERAEAQQAVAQGLGSLEPLMEGLPGRLPGTGALPAGLGAGLEGLSEHFSAASGVDSAQVQQRINQAASRLKGLGSSLITGTSELLEQVSGAISAELDSLEAGGRHAPGGGAGRSSGAARYGAAGGAGGGAAQKYSRLDAEISAMQRNSSTYSDEPEDRADYEAWLAGFDLAARKGDIDAIVARNAFMAELQTRIVPFIVQHEAFWTRYFYQLHKLQQKHEQRQKVASMARAAAVANEKPAAAWDDEASNPATPQPSPSRPAPAATPPKDTVRVGAARSPPPPVAVKPAQGASPRAEDRGSSSSSPVAVKGGDEHSGSDVDTSTASEESGGHAWTVVTSPSARAAAKAKAQAGPVALAAAAPAAEGEDEGEVCSPQAKGQGPAAAAAQPPASSGVAKEPSKEALKPVTGAAAAAAAAAATSAAVSKAAGDKAGAQPAKPAAAAAAEDDEEDLEISDEEGAAAAGDAESDVDEDWGGDWE